MEVKLIPAHLELDFEEDFGGREFQTEFDNHSEVDDDPVGHWLRMAKARGETVNTDSVLVTLLVELHRKVDSLTDKIEGNKPEKIQLQDETVINSIHFDHFRIESTKFKKGTRYYGRIIMPSFPQRDISLFFEALSETDGKIIQLHDRDEKAWSSYVTARERVMIRKLKEKGKTL